METIKEGIIIQGKYRIKEKVGEGGFSIVYKAIDIDLEKAVAIKFLKKELANISTYRKKFFKEVKIVACLNHPCIIPIRSFGNYKGLPFIVMDFNPGKTLKEVLKERKLTSKEIYQISYQLLDCLSYAHNKGIVHRDLKTSNLMIRYINENIHLSILDFGIAFIKTKKSNKVIGSFLYMAPEQILGEKLDHRVDIFSAGIIIYELLTKKLPYEDEKIEDILQRIILKKKITLKNLPKHLKKVLEKALEIDKEKRYNSANEFWKDLKKALKTKEIYSKLYFLVGSFIITLIIISFFLKIYINEKTNYLKIKKIIRNKIENQQYKEAINYISHSLFFKNKLYKLIKRLIYKKFFYFLEKKELQKAEKLLNSSRKIYFKNDKDKILYNYLYFTLINHKLYYIYNTSSNFSLDKIKINYFFLESISQFLKECLVKQTYRAILLKYIEKKDINKTLIFLRRIVKIYPEFKKLEKIIEKKYKKSQIEDYNKKNKQKIRKKIYEFLKKKKYLCLLDFLENNIKLKEIYYTENLKELIRDEILKSFTIDEDSFSLITQDKIIEIKGKYTNEIFLPYIKVNNFRLKYNKKNKTWFSKVILEKGGQNIAFIFKYKTFSLILKKFFIYLDKLPPNIKIDKITINKKKQKIEIKGEVKDNIGIGFLFPKPTSIKRIDSRYYKYIYKIPFPKVKDLIIKVIDLAGNIKEKKIELKKDTQKPDIKIIQPSPNDIIYTNKVLLKAIIKDKEGIKIIKINNKNQNFNLDNNKNIYVENIINFPKNKKIFKIEISAEDIWGNKNKVCLKVKFSKKWEKINKINKIKIFRNKIWGMVEGYKSKLLIISGDNKILCNKINKNKLELIDKYDWRIIRINDFYFYPGIIFVSSYLESSSNIKEETFIKKYKIGGIWRVNYQELKENGFKFLIKYLDDGVSHIAFSKDLNKIMLGYKGGYLKVINKTKVINKFKAHKGNITSLICSNDGKYIITGGGDKLVKIWNLENNKIKLDFIINIHKLPILSLSLNKDNRIMALGSIDKTLSLWDLKYKTFIKKIRGLKSIPNLIIFSYNEPYIFVGTIDGNLIILGD